MNVLAAILSSRTRAEIFRLLFGPVSQSLHLREMERRTGLSTGSLRQEISKLQKLGLVTIRKDGNRVCYEPNNQHPLYQDIHSLVLKTAGLADILRDALKDKNIRFAFVFGSVARGEETAESDIDLMVIGNIGLRKIAGLLSGVSEQIGREINPHALTESEFAMRLKKRENLVSGIMVSSKLFIIGNEHEFKAVGKKRLVESAQDKCRRGGIR